LRGTSRREDGRDPGGPMDSAAALEGARRYLSGLQPEDHHGDGVAQPPYRVANPWGQGYDREPRAGAPELPSTDPQPRVRCGKAASCEGRSRGLSCMKGNFHVQFLGEGVAATSPPYPTLGGRPPRSTRPGFPPDFPEAPALGILDKDQVEVLVCRFGKGIKPSQPTIGQAVLWIGRLGGHLNRKRDGMPGVRTLWRGLHDLTLLVAG